MQQCYHNLENKIALGLSLLTTTLHAEWQRDCKRWIIGKHHCLSLLSRLLRLSITLLHFLLQLFRNYIWWQDGVQQLEQLKASQQLITRSSSVRACFFQLAHQQASVALPSSQVIHKQPDQLSSQFILVCVLFVVLQSFSLTNHYPWSSNCTPQGLQQQEIFDQLLNVDVLGECEFDSQFVLRKQSNMKFTLLLKIWRTN